MGDETQWCARRLLARIHGYTQKRLRREIEPVTAQDFMRFLLRWHHVAPGTKRSGRDGLVATIEQLQGYEVSAGAWEQSILPSRIEGYRRDWLDQLCHSGELAWARLGLRTAGAGAAGAAADDDGGSTITSRATLIALMLRA